MVSKFKSAWGSYYRGIKRKQHLPSKSMKVLSKFFKKNKVKTILDFSSGIGRNTIYLAEKGFDLYGFDRSAEAIKHTKSELKRRKLVAKMKVWNMQNKLPYKNDFFDAVIVIRAMYHAKLRDIKKIADDTVRITKPNGFIYIESDQRPVKGVKHGKMKLVETRTYYSIDGDWKGLYYHIFSKSELRNLFKNCRIKRFYFKDRNFCMLVQKI